MPTGLLSLTLWLFVKGLNVPRWKEQAGAAVLLRVVRHYKSRRRKPDAELPKSPETTWMQIAAFGRVAQPGA